MALEDLTGAGKYISNLVITNPLSADDRREGDDHIRGIKNVLKNSFPTLAGPVTFSDYVLKAGDTMTGALKLADGTVAAPSLAFASDPGVGWYRYGVGQVSMAAGGQKTLAMSFLAAATTIVAAPISAGQCNLFLTNQPIGAVNYNNLDMYVLAGSGGGFIHTTRVGTAVATPLTLRGSEVRVQADQNVGSPSLVLMKNLHTDQNIIWGRLQGKNRWVLSLGDATGETGANQGSNLAILRYNDAGDYLGTPFNINRATGNVTAQGLTRLADFELLRAVVQELTARIEALEAAP